MKPRPYLAVLSLLTIISCGDSEGPTKGPATTTEEKTAPAGGGESTIVPGTKTEAPSGAATDEVVTPPPEGGAAATPPPAPPPTPPPPPAPPSTPTSPTPFSGTGGEASLVLRHPCTDHPELCRPVEARRPIVETAAPLAPSSVPSSTR